MYGIAPRPWGFEVSLVRNGTRYYKQFGQASYGGLDQALLQAQDWRDAVVRSVPPPARRARAEKVRVNNTTGLPGVFCQVTSGGRVRSWVAKTYLAKDEILRTDFPVDAVDAGGAALALAIEEREKQLSLMSGLARLHPAEEAIRRGMTVQPPGPRARKRSKSEITRSTNSSGVSGVQFKMPNAGHPGYWLATTATKGKSSMCKAFSVKAHGYDMAKSLAIAERARQLAIKLREAGQQEPQQKAPEPFFQRDTGGQAARP